MMVVIFIQNNNNEFLIQKRSLDKWGKWASIDEINNLMNICEFNKGHYMMFKDCLEFLNK